MVLLTRFQPRDKDVCDGKWHKTRSELDRIQYLKNKASYELITPHFNQKSHFQLYLIFLKPTEVGKF